MDKTELLSALAALTDDEKRAILGMSTATAAPQSPKFSVALDQVPDDQVEQVVNACRTGLKAIADATPNGPQAVGDAEAAADTALAQVAPVVAAAARRNCQHRQKPMAHSLSVAITYLQSAEAEAKRKAKRRKVPQPKTTTTAESAKGGK
jgi:hypothetical protein